MTHEDQQKQDDVFVETLSLKQCGNPTLFPSTQGPNLLIKLITVVYFHFVLTFIFQFQFSLNYFLKQVL